nr:hypothetical protein C1N82_32820 [Bacillus cereus]
MTSKIKLKLHCTQVVLHSESIVGKKQLLIIMAGNGKTGLSLILRGGLKLVDQSLLVLNNKKLVIKTLETVLERKIVLDPNINLKDEGLDSLKTIELIVSLEEEFDIQIDDEDLIIDNFLTIGKMFNLLIEKYGIKL